MLAFPPTLKSLPKTASQTVPTNYYILLPFWGLSKPPFCPLGGSFGGCFGLLGPPLAFLGRPKKPKWEFAKRFWALLGVLGALLERSWSDVGPRFAAADVLDRFLTL